MLSTHCNDKKIKLRTDLRTVKAQEKSALLNAKSGSKIGKIFLKS